MASIDQIREKLRAATHEDHVVCIPVERFLNCARPSRGERFRRAMIIHGSMSDCRSYLISSDNYQAMKDLLDPTIHHHVLCLLGPGIDSIENYITTQNIPHVRHNNWFACSKETVEKLEKRFSISIPWHKYSPYPPM